MKRREFIRMGSFLTVSVAALGVTACSSDKSTAATGTAPLPMPPDATGNTWQFPQSVASGDPTDTSGVFWTRVVPSSLTVTDATTVSAAIQLQITAVDNSASLGSNTALTGTLLADVKVPAYSDFDGTVRHKVTGLTAGTVYYYQFVAGGVYSKVGRFKTAADSSSTSDVKFAFMTCQDWGANHWAAFDDIVANHNDLDFVVHLGDYIYETDELSGGESVHTAITLPNGTYVSGSSGAKYATTTPDYRYLYKLYRSDARIQAMHERNAMVAIWDDHEFTDDAWQDHETYDNSNPEQLSRRRNANQAWYEFMPADISYSATDSSFENITIYRDLKFGSVVHLVMTDERLYRNDHVIPENTISPLTGQELGRINSRYLAPEPTFKYFEYVKSTTGLSTSGDSLALLSMLGSTQRNWWKSTMANSTSVWKVWGNEVSLLRMGLNGTNALATLISLNVYSTLATSATQGIAAVAASSALTSPPASVSAAIVAAVSANASLATAQAAAVAIATDAGGGGTPSSEVAAAVGAGLTLTQAQAAVGAFNNAIAVGNIVIASAIVAAAAAGVSNTTTAGTIGFAITAADANPAATDNDRKNAAQAAGATAFQADVAVSAYNAAKAAAAGGSSAQVLAAAQTVAFVKAKPDIIANKQNSPFIIALDTSVGAGTVAKITPFFQKFLINADQWDGYEMERKTLMNFLVDQGIQNVVATTGDLHAFFAGQVYGTFASEVQTFTLDTSGNVAEASAAASSTSGTTPVASAAMIDLVTAGVSSTSWFQFVKAAVDSLDPTHALIGNLVYYPIDLSTSFGEAAGTTVVNLNLLDYSMGKAAPASASELAAQLNGQIKQALSAHGVPEAALDLDASTPGSAAYVQAGIAAKPEFAAALGLAQQLSALGQATNPWLKHIDTEAQGYAVVTASTGSLTCTFNKVNPLVGTAAPSASRIVAATKTATITLGSTTVVIS